MGWQRICLLESVLTPFMPAAEVSLTKFSRWLICIIWIFLVLISRCSFVLGLGKALGFCSLPAWFWRSHSSPCAPMPLCREEINIISWLLGMSGGCAEDEVAFRYLTCEWEYSKCFLMSARSTCGAATMHFLYVLFSFFLFLTHC